jgi:hypothetical protein
VDMVLKASDVTLLILQIFYESERNDAHRNKVIHIHVFINRHTSTPSK